MVPLVSLWLPIVVSAVIVFVLSSIIHMVLPIHRGDFRRMPAEDQVMEALRKFDLPPGDYMVPCPASPKDMRSPEFEAKKKAGPNFIATFWKPTSGMAPMLFQWFLYLLVVGVFAGYIASRALEPGADYLMVFRFVGATAFCGYALALWQHSIWYRRPWSTTIKYTIDGLLYALMTGGTFGWLWPK